MVMNRLGDSGTSIVLHCLRDFIRLDGLSLGSTGCLAWVAEQVYQCLGALRNLKFIDIAMYKATDEGIKWIANLIAESKIIQAVSVSCNGISEEGIKLLIYEGILVKDSLIHLEYQQYGLKRSGELVKAIDSKHELNWIKLPHSQGLDLSSKYQYVQNFKHSPLVEFIGSVYR